MTMDLVADLKSLLVDKPSVVQQKPMLIGRNVNTQVSSKTLHNYVCAMSRRYFFCRMCILFFLFFFQNNWSFNQPKIEIMSTLSS